MSVIFITGGAGYIGSATSYRLSKLGYTVVVYDSAPVKNNHFFKAPIISIHGDICDNDRLIQEMKRYKPSVVLHLAAKTSVLESEKQKKLYEETNVKGTKNVLLAMKACGCTKIIFASSASVYGLTNNKLPENTPLPPMNVYAKTKRRGEELIQAERTLNWVIFRYFNVVGATHDGLFGESVKESKKLIPSVLRTGLGVENNLTIYGNSYPTPDGTAIRDYVSLEDVVRANVMAVDHLQEGKPSLLCNIGSGVGIRNLEVVHAVEKQLRKNISIQFKRSRQETITSVANIFAVKNAFGWNPNYSSLPNIIAGLVSFQKTLHQ